MTYIAPCDAPVSENWAEHKNRDTPSREPGTDYACAYGTPLVSPASGIVVTVDNDPGGAEGRRWTLIADDGGVLDMIHNSIVYGEPGDRVEQGQTVARSGGSGYGINVYYGPHVHVTYRERDGLSYSQSSDFETRLGASWRDPASTTIREDEEMAATYINVEGVRYKAGTFAIMRDNAGALFAKRVTTDTHLEGVPTIPDSALDSWQNTMPFLDL